MRVLVTNDDGIDSPWLHALAEAFTTDGHLVTVLAPASNCSGMSGALAPMPVAGEIDIELHQAPEVAAEEAWAARDCSPSVCVLLGLGGFVDHDFDLVVSGINHGWNIGRDIWRSGTAWAAITAWGMGLPALAVSAAITPYPQHDRQDAVIRTVRVAKRLADAPEPELWNLNFPTPPSRQWAEETFVPLARNERLSASDLVIVRRPDEGEALVRMRQEPGLQVVGTPGTDADVVQRGGVTLSRLRPIDAVVDER